MKDVNKNSSTGNDNRKLVTKNKERRKEIISARILGSQDKQEWKTWFETATCQVRLEFSPDYPWFSTKAKVVYLSEIWPSKTNDVRRLVNKMIRQHAPEIAKLKILFRHVGFHY